MPLINWESASTIDNQVPTFTITDRKLYVPAVTLSIQDDAKLLKLGFKRAINQNKHQSKATKQTQNPNLDYLIDPNFQGGDTFFVLSFENN